MTETLRSVHYASTDNPVPDLRLQHARYRAVANQSIATATNTVQTYDTTVAETAGISQAAGIISVTEPGLYNVAYVTEWVPNNFGGREQWIAVGGTLLRLGETISNGDIGVKAFNGSTTVLLAAGETVSIIVLHTAGVNLNLAGAGSREVAITKLGVAAK